MRNAIITAVILLVLSDHAVSQASVDPITEQPGMVARSFNLSTFGPQYKTSGYIAEFYNRVPQEFQNHPEYGSVPYIQD